jgi:hypothetical protein
MEADPSAKGIWRFSGGMAPGTAAEAAIACPTLTWPLVRPRSPGGAKGQGATGNHVGGLNPQLGLAPLEVGESLVAEEGSVVGRCRVGAIVVVSRELEALVRGGLDQLGLDVRHQHLPAEARQPLGAVVDGELGGDEAPARHAGYSIDSIDEGTVPRCGLAHCQADAVAKRRRSGATP